MKILTKTIMAIGAILSVSFISAQAQIIITEVDAAGSGTTTYAQDWFELTNEGSLAVNIGGWTMDDSSNSVGDSVALTGVSTIGAGQSVVFIEDTKDSRSNAQIGAAFEQAWFGSNVPAGLTLGYYGGSGVGLSTGGDGVNIFDATGAQVTGVSFGASAANGATFDNSVLKLGGANDPLISTFSAVGVDGAFASNTGGEIGSPGVAEAPEPSSFALMLGSFGLLALGLRRRVAGLL